jgi:hypothetical protein
VFWEELQILFADGQEEFDTIWNKNTIKAASCKFIDFFNWFLFLVKGGGDEEN